MSKLMTSAAFAALLLAATGPAALAQGQSSAPGAAAPSSQAQPAAPADQSSQATPGTAKTQAPTADNGAADQGTSGKHSDETASVPSRIMPGQMRFSQLDGATVRGTNNKDIGDVSNIVLDPRGKIVAVAIHTGGFLGLGGKTIAVSMHDISQHADKNGKPLFTIDMTQQQLKSAQAYNLSLPQPQHATTGSGGSMAPATGMPRPQH